MKSPDTYSQSYQHSPMIGKASYLYPHFLIPNSDHLYWVQCPMQSELAYLYPLSAKRTKSILPQPRFSVPLSALHLARLAAFRGLVPSSEGPTQQETILNVKAKSCLRETSATRVSSVPLYFRQMLRHFLVPADFGQALLPQNLYCPLSPSSGAIPHVTWLGRTLQRGRDSPISHRANESVDVLD
jgi:hypothetical protein